MRAKHAAECLGCKLAAHLPGFILRGKGRAQLDRKIRQHFKKAHPGRRCVAARILLSSDS